jgi:hypothetical protein
MSLIKYSKEMLSKISTDAKDNLKDLFWQILLKGLMIVEFHLMYGIKKTLMGLPATFWSIQAL